jgi:hypothetical protein
LEKTKNAQLLFEFNRLRLLAGDYWQLDLVQAARRMQHGFLFSFANASTINGKLGDLFNCSGKPLQH